MTVVATDTRLSGALEELTAELERWQVPALELTVVQDGVTVHAGALGVGSASTLFHHGSCGKAYTGLLATLLAEDGVVDLDVPVRRYVPELRLPDPVVAERVTLRDLLSHRSGLGRHDMAWILNPSLTADDFVARLEHLPLVGDLRAKWSYSNFGYVLAGVALGRAAGDDWHALLRKRVLEPLGMSRSLTSEQLAQADPDHAVPHVSRDRCAVPTQWRVFDAMAPAGGVISCADDSVRWLLAQLGGDDVSPNAVAETHRPQMLLPAGVAPFAELEFSTYGLGWVTGTYRGRRLVWHNGGVDGFTTQTLLLPEQNIGVLACANQHLTNFPLAVVLHVADVLLGEQAGAQSWFDRLRTEAPSNADVPEQPASRSAVRPPVGRLRRPLSQCGLRRPGGRRRRRRARRAGRREPGDRAPPLLRDLGPALRAAAGGLPGDVHRRSGRDRERGAGGIRRRFTGPVRATAGGEVMSMDRRWAAVVVLALAAAGCGSTAEQASTVVGSSQQTSAGSPEGLSVPGGVAPAGGSAGQVGATGTVPGAGPAGSAPGASSAAGGTSVHGSAGGLTNVPGVTPTRIYVGITYATGDDAANKALGNNITTGDQQADAQAVVDDINAHGGVAGRKLTPVWYDYQETDARPYATIDDEACAKFTQDNHVFAVTGDGLSDEFPACILKGGAMIVSSASGLIGPDKAFFARFPYVFSVGYLTQERMMAEEVRSLVRQNYFTGWDSVNGAPGSVPVKIGIISFDTEAWSTPLHKVLLPGLARAGHPVDPANVQEVTYPSDTNQAGSSVADIQSAVLKFRQNNVTHVIVLDQNGSMTLHMLNNMRGQHYYPRLGVNSASGVEALYSQYAEDKTSFNGAVGLGWLPELDLPAGDGDRYNTAATKACIAMVERRTGQKFTDTNAASVALGECDQLYLLADAINHAVGGVSRDTVSAAIEAVHGSFTAAGTPGLYFSPARHDGIEYGYDLRFDNACSCVKYGRGPFQIPDV